MKTYKAKLLIDPFFILGFILTLGFILIVWSGIKIGHRIGYKNGWMAACIDSNAIRNYHQKTDALPDDSDKIALAATWLVCILDAQRIENEWKSKTIWQKWNYEIAPFWKQNHGQPRRISGLKLEKLKTGIMVTNATPAIAGVSMQYLVEKTTNTFTNYYKSKTRILPSVDKQPFTNYNSSGWTVSTSTFPISRRPNIARMYEWKPGHYRLESTLKPKVRKQTTNESWPWIIEFKAD